MRTTCLVNNYNYAPYLPEAVDSVLRQTIPFDEIIIVDDGSTDGSPALLRARYGGHSSIRIIAKQNEGQLSCFNRGFAASHGDLIFFLDADDVYESDYLERVTGVYRERPWCDFVFTASRFFGRQSGVQRLFNRDRDMGYSVVSSLVRRRWLGAQTSALSMRRPILERFLELPLQEDWRTMADVCLVYGASLAGARKYYLDAPLIRYRIHDANRHWGREQDAARTAQLRQAVERLLDYLVRRMGYNPATLMAEADREFISIPEPSFKELRRYGRLMLRSQAGWRRKVRAISTMIGHYRTGSRRRGAKRGAQAESI
ncbi:MAG TPA: glycosyltransferase family A protein [Candidatus Polarisedimenticolia bacterium]|nr:glycosyltransferase family A protein [Candidatus Polarisedimenticolia bacterium]